MYPDAGDDYWPVIATQVRPKEVNITHREQIHTTLAFISGHFTVTQLRWSIMETEYFTIVASLGHFNWLVATPEGSDL